MGKKLIIVVANILLTGSLLILNANAEMAHCTGVFESSIVNDNKVFIAKYGLSDSYAEVYKCASVKSELFILGRTAEYNLLLSSLNLNNGRLNIIREFESSEFVFDMQNAEFVLVNSFVILEYTSGNLGRVVDERIKKIEILKMNNDDEYVKINQAQISENSISLSDQRGQNDKYIYLAVNNSQDDEYIAEPARQELPDIFMADINGDGYKDILIWKKVYLSKMVDSNAKKPFVIDQEELNAMLFDKETGTFSKIEPVNWDE